MSYSSFSCACCHFFGTGIGQGLFEVGEPRHVLGHGFADGVTGKPCQVATGQSRHDPIGPGHQLEPQLIGHFTGQSFDRLPPRKRPRDVTGDSVGLDDFGHGVAAAGRHAADEGDSRHC